VCVSQRHVSSSLAVRGKEFSTGDYSRSLATSARTKMNYWQIIVDCIAVVGSIVSIIAFLMYLHERRKRRDNENVVLGFLHGIKPMVEGAAQRDSAWNGFIRQINDILSRLQPPKGR
jgi:hypothetical protein